MQIVLSELLGVPTTIESGSADRSFNFYDPNLAFSYSDEKYVRLFIPCLEVLALSDF